MKNLPVLALDVDGPLFLLGDLDAATLVHSQVDGIPVAWSSNLTTMLTALSANFRIVWSSAWGRRASHKVAPLVGLPTGLPYIRFKSNRELRPGDSYKLGPLANWLKDLPAAIVDDEVGQDVKEWARTRPAPTLLVEVDPRRGLQPHHLHELLIFSERVRLG